MFFRISLCSNELRQNKSRHTFNCTSAHFLGLVGWVNFPVLCL
nr:MAG TPA: hypothetical protein [Caudoviricetes sp.]